MNGNNYIRWKLINEILNMLRRAKREKLRPKTDNPYRKGFDEISY